MTKNEMNVYGDFYNITISCDDNKNSNLVEIDKFNYFEPEELNDLMYKSLKFNHRSCADLIYYYYGNQYNYGEDNNWYHYENHKWNLLEKSNMRLNFRAEKQISDLYAELINYFERDGLEANKLKKIRTFEAKLGDEKFFVSVMNKAKIIFMEKNNPDRNFVAKLDSNLKLIGFNNGVYDLDTFEFRDGKPDDFVSMSVGYNYNSNYSEKYEELLKFLEDIQPNKNIRDYLMHHVSHALYGNTSELFTILTGNGRNGKSKFINLLNHTFGDYSGTVGPELFTRPPPDHRSPDPGLLNLVKKKIVIGSEPGKNEKLNSAFIKFITGRDQKELRNCHSNSMVNFKANFVTFLNCNDIPETDDIDEAFSKRLRCVKFPTEFCNNPIKEDQKLCNEKINEKFDDWKVDFMIFLINLYKNYVLNNNDLQIPADVFKWTNQYKEETDIYLQFLNECTVKSQTHIKGIDLYNHFYIWFKKYSPNSKNIPKKRLFFNKMRSHGYEPGNVKIEGEIEYGFKSIKILR